MTGRSNPTLARSPINDPLLDSWDQLRRAIDSLQTALPSQMTERAAHLHLAQQNMDAAIKTSFRNL